MNPNLYLAAEESAIPTTASIRRNSVARLLANLARMIAGLAAATIAARVLGPAGKGTLSSMLYLLALLGYGCTLGLGEAGVVLVGKGLASRRELVPTALLPILVMSIVGAAILWVIAWEADWSHISLAVWVATLYVPIATLGSVLSTFHHSLERLVFTSVLAVIKLLIDLCGLVLFLLVFDLGIVGAVLALTVAELVATIAKIVAWAKLGFPVLPTFDWVFVRRAVRFGLPLGAAELLMALSQRIDLLLIYALAGEATAGRYSIALTIGVLVSFVAGPLTVAVFPRMAQIPETQAAELTSRAARMSLAISLLAGTFLALIAPVVIPLAFGDEFASAVWPTMILLVAGVVWSEQLILSRLAAARNQPRVPFVSHGVSLGAMVILDVLLIPSFGAIGAAFAALVANCIGLLIPLRWSLRAGGIERIGDLVPRYPDFVELLHALRRVMGVIPSIRRSA